MTLVTSGGPAGFGTHHPRPDESCYLFTVVDRQTGHPAEAFLTYEVFPSQSFERTLLLTDDENLLQSDEDRAGFAALKKTLDDRDAGRFLATKSVVNEIVERRIDLPNVGIAVHKFGPVPAYVLSNPIEVSVHGRAVVARIAVVPRRSRSGCAPRTYLSRWEEQSTRPLFTSSRDEVRQCLSVGLHISFRRYLEDAAEDLRDLRRILSKGELYKRAKRVERTLAQSVGSKLNRLVPSRPLPETADAREQDAWAHFRRNASILYEAAFARTLILYFLNEVYEVIGIASRAAEYSERLSTVHRKFDELLGTDDWIAARDSSRVIQFLEDCQERYFASAPNEYHAAGELISLARSSPELWCGEVAKFAAFALIVRKIGVQQPFVRLFVSHHHEVAASECVRDQLVDYVSQVRPKMVAVALKDLPPAVPLRHIIRSAIWLCQGTIAICPRDTGSIVTAAVDDKDYRWIAREAEHALLLQKSVLFGVEVGATTENIRRDFADSRIGYLVGGTKVDNDESRARRIADHFANYLNATFTITSASRSADYLDPRLRNTVKTFAGQVSVNAVSDLLDGYVNQFDLATRKALLFSLSCFGPLGKCAKSIIVRRLAGAMRTSERAAERAFVNMWRQVRDRHIELPGRRPMSLIELRDDRYMERLTAAAFPVRNTLGVRGYKRWRGEWLAARTLALGLTVSPRWLAR